MTKLSNKYVYLKSQFLKYGRMKLIQIFCQHNHLISKCLNCKVASSSLRFARTYKQCQLQLLQYLSSKESFIPKQKNEFSALKKLIKSKSLIIGFARLCCLFLVANEKKITKVKEAHCKDLKDLGMVSLAGSHNPDKLIVNQLPYRRIYHHEKTLPFRKQTMATRFLF